MLQLIIIILLQRNTALLQRVKRSRQELLGQYIILCYEDIKLRYTRTERGHSEYLLEAAREEYNERRKRVKC